MECVTLSKHVIMTSDGIAIFMNMQEKIGYNLINKSASTLGFYHSLWFLALFFILLFCIVYIK